MRYIYTLLKKDVLTGDYKEIKRFESLASISEYIKWPQYAVFSYATNDKDFGGGFKVAIDKITADFHKKELKKLAKNCYHRMLRAKKYNVSYKSAAQTYIEICNTMLNSPVFFSQSIKKLKPIDERFFEYHKLVAANIGVAEYNKRLEETLLDIVAPSIYNKEDPNIGKMKRLLGNIGSECIQNCCSVSKGVISIDISKIQASYFKTISPKNRRSPALLIAIVDYLEGILVEPTKR